MPMASFTPVRADEIASGKDRFAKQTFELTLPLRTTPKVQNMTVSVFRPRAMATNVLKVHVFWGPGDAAESWITKTPLQNSRVGLNHTNMHGLRGSTDSSGWILVSVPGIDDRNFVMMSLDDIAACITAAFGGSQKYSGDDITQLRLSAHSRGSLGLVMSLVAPPANVPWKPIPANKVDRVVIFDSVYADVDRILAASAIDGKKQFAYQVTFSKKLSKGGATNVAIDPTVSRAIGYSRLIADLPITAPGATVPPFPGTLLTLPPRTQFTTRGGMKNINTYYTKGDIANVLKNETGPSGIYTYIDKNNLTQMGSFKPDILAHHLFVAELAHETVD